MYTEAYIIAIDQGTSSSKTRLFDAAGQVCARGDVKLDIHYSGNFVEQSPQGIYQSVLDSVRICLADACKESIDLEKINAVALTNQRETFVLWDSKGEPLYHAISWQCKRSSAICDRLKAAGKENMVKEKTGLTIDPYFSATKLMWLVEEVPAIAEALHKGDLFFGTIDTWLLYKLSNGKTYLTDHSNASRTMLYNIYTLQWDEELLGQLGLKGLHLPEVRASAAFYTETDFDGLCPKPLPLYAVIGDSQAAALGGGCFERGTAKATLGTGTSTMMAVGSGLRNKGKDSVDAIYYSTAQGVVYAAEGIIVSCGATITWLKEQLQLFQDEADLEQIACSVPADHGLTLIPGFSGMGAPYWKKDAKAAILGLTFASDGAHLIRAALESVCFQVKDVILMTEQEHGLSLSQLIVNGGMSKNAFVVQFLADVLEKPVRCSSMPDASALGAARLAASALWKEPIDKTLNGAQAHVQLYQPNPKREEVHKNYALWQTRIQQVIG